MVETQKEFLFYYVYKQVFTCLFLWEILRDKKCSGIFKCFRKDKEEKNY